MPLVVAHSIRVPALSNPLPPILSLIPNKVQLEFFDPLITIPPFIEPAETLIVTRLATLLSRLKLVGGSGQALTLSDSLVEFLPYGFQNDKTILGNAV